MATRPTEDIDLDDLNRVDDAIREALGDEEAETSFTDDRPLDDVTIDSSIPNVGRDVGVIRRAYTQDKKDFLRRELGVKVNKKDAPEIFNNLDLTEGGAKYKGVDVLVTHDGSIVYNPDSNVQTTVNEFKRLIQNEKEKYSKSLEGNIDKQAAENIGIEPSEVDTETAEEVIDRVYDRIHDRVLTRTDEIVTGITGNELGEFMGSIRSKDIPFLEIQGKHWRDLSEKTTDLAKKELYENMADVCELKADYLRLLDNQIPETEEVKEIIKEEIENSDMTRFQRFKKWALENLTGISAVAISIAGIVTTIVMAGRKAVRLGAKGVSSLARSLVALGKKLGPVIGAVLNLAGNLLSLGAKGISFLANNLWLVVVIITSYLIYNKREWLPKRKS